MAATSNAGSTFLAAATPRLLVAANATILLSTSTPVFKVDTSGSPNIISVTVNAKLIACDGTPTFSCTGGTLSSITASSAVLTFAAMSANTATITATLSYRGQTLTSSVAIAKVVDGTNGTPGIDSPPQTAAQLKATLTGQITESELFSALQTRIGLIDATDTTTGSVASRVKAETDARVAAITQEASDRTTYVQTYAYSKAASDSSLSVQASTITANYTAYADAAKASAISTASADVRNYSYSKASADSSLAAQSSTLTANYTSYADTKTASAVAGIIIGGRNFLLNSQYIVDYASNTNTGTSTLMNDEAVPYYRVAASAGVSTYTSISTYSKILVGTVCTISCDVRVPTAGNVGFYNGQGYQAVPANVWTRISYTFTYTGAYRETGHSYSGTQLDYRNYKVEIGNKATDWTPAPEDVTTAIDGVQTTAAADVRSYAYSKANVDSSIASSATSLTASYQSADTTNLNAAKTYADASVVTYAYSKAATDSAIASSTNSVSARLDNISGSGVTVEQKFTAQATTNTGLLGQYTVKIDSNGHVAGFGLASTAINGVPTSSFIVTADKFAISYPGVTTMIPFAVGNVNGTSVIGISGNTIIDGSFIVRNSSGVVLFDVGGLKAGAEAPGTKNSDIKLGGRNFYLDSQHAIMYANNTGTGTAVLTNDENVPYYHVTAASGNTVSLFGDIYQFPKIPIGTQCVISADVRVPVTGVVNFYNGQGGAMVPANVWTRISFVFTYDGTARQTGFTYIASNLLDYRNCKVEIGNIASDWTPAPEDIDSGISTAATTSTWAGTTGTGKPADNATVGAPSGTNVGSTSATTVESNAANGQSAYTSVNDATTGLASRLRNNADNVLGGILSANVVSAPAGFRAGTLTWDATGTRTGGYGVAITPKGLVGYTSAGVLTFAIDATTGAATFAGALSAATGSFAGSLTAATGTFGAVTIATGGSLSSGQTAFDTGTGFWLGLVSGTPKFSLGTAGGTGIKWDGSTLTIKDATMVKTTAFAVSVTPSSDTKSYGHSASEQYFGRYTASSTGGNGASTFDYSLDLGNASAQGMTARIVRVSNTLVDVYGKCNVVANCDIYVIIGAVDASGIAAVKATLNINVDWS